MTAHYIARHRRPGPGPPGRRAHGDRDDRRDHRPDRRPDRRRATPTRPTATSTSASRSFRRVRQALEPRRSTTWTRARATTRRRPQGVAAGLRALEGAEGGRGHRLGRALGPRPSRLAHRVLGDGRADPRRRLRRPRRRLRPRLPAPRERDRPDRGRARQAARPDLDAQRDAPLRRARRCRSRWATSACCSRRSTSTAATRWSCTSSAATTASRSSYSRRALEQAAAAVGAGARASRAGSTARRVDARRARRLRGALLRRAGRRLQHARGARRAVRLDHRGQPPPGRRREAAAAGALREMLCVLGLDNLLEADEGADRRGAAPARRARGRPPAAKNFARRRREAATSWRRSAGSYARQRAGRYRSLVPRAVIIYGRNAVHEALRGTRRVIQRWCHGPPPPASTASSRVDYEVAHPRRARGALRIARPPGRLRRGRAIPYADADRPAARRGRPRPRARRDHRPAQPRRRLPRRRVRRRRGRRDPRAPLRRRHARRVQDVGRRGRAPARREGAQRLATTSTDAKERRRLGLRGRRRGGDPYDQPDYSGQAVLVLGAEGRGLRPEWQAPATHWSRCRSAARWIRSTSPRPPPPLCTESCNFACRVDKDIRHLRATIDLVQRCRARSR